MSLSSIVTAVPSGVVGEWCIRQPRGFHQEPQQCANATRGTEESDFTTICCDGMIIDTTKNIWRGGGGPINVDNLVCCRVEGPQAGGLRPLPMGEPTTCESGTPVPLASLAATNTLNAQDFLVTYTSASFGGPVPGDFVPTQSPFCLWAYTKSGVVMASVTVQAAKITTLSTSSDYFGYIDTTSSSSTTSTTKSSGESPSSNSTQSSPTSAPTSSSSRFSLRDGLLLGMACGLIVTLQGHL